jgi:hypothetical protein
MGVAKASAQCASHAEPSQEHGAVENAETEKKPEQWETVAVVAPCSTAKGEAQSGAAKIAGREFPESS